MPVSNLASLAAAAFRVSARNGENAVLFAVADHVEAVDVRRAGQELAVMRNTRKALTTGVTWLTRDGVLSQPTSHIGALTLLSADCVLAWRQLGLKHDVNFTKCRYRSEHTKTKCRI